MIRKRNFAWWSKFNYVLSSALDSGTVISIMIVFFILQVSCFSFFLVGGVGWIFERSFFFFSPLELENCIGGVI